jgi:F-type H+-transporting ATPase subunit delta
MAENLTLARPYAEAAFQLARGSSGAGLKAWSDGLAQLAAATARPELQACIGNPRFSLDQLSALCLEVAGNGLTAEQQNFVKVLVDNNRLDVVAEIASLYEELKNGHEGVKEAHITSAFPIDSAALATLVAGLEQRFGCKVQATVTLDAELIGGVRIAIGDEVIDASVRGKLAAMATALKN